MFLTRLCSYSTNVLLLKSNKLEGFCLSRALAALKSLGAYSCKHSTFSFKLLMFLSIIFNASPGSFLFSILIYTNKLHYSLLIASYSAYSSVSSCYLQTSIAVATSKIVSLPPDDDAFSISADIFSGFLVLT